MGIFDGRSEGRIGGLSMPPVRGKRGDERVVRALSQPHQGLRFGRTNGSFVSTETNFRWSTAASSASLSTIHA